MTDKIQLKDIIIKDFWLWGQVRFLQTKCPECGYCDGEIVIQKGKDLSKFIKILQNLNYKGIKKTQRRQKQNGQKN